MATINYLLHKIFRVRGSIAKARRANRKTIHTSSIEIGTYPKFERLNFYEKLLESLYVSGESFSPVCSTIDYALAAAKAKNATSGLMLLNNKKAAGLFVSTETRTENGIALIPAEINWGFSTNLFAVSPHEAITFLNEICGMVPDLKVIFLTGVTPTLKQALLKQQNLTHAFKVEELAEVENVVANIENGAEGVIKNVSLNKRKNLKRALAHRVEISFDYIRGSDAPDLVWKRLIAVEKQSWKWKSNQSIFQSPQYAVFYLELFKRFNAKELAHVLFVQHQGRDIAYVFGATQFNSFRGFQTSLVDEQQIKNLSPGHNAHLYLMDILSKQGIISYNFGMTIDYKKAWSNQKITTSSICLFPQV